jgi:hypothetical protein
VLKDAALLNRNLEDFASKFQMLDEKSPEIDFYLQRSDYYSALGFDDSVYRLLQEIRKTPDILPQFDQIVIDEYPTVLVVGKGHYLKEIGKQLRKDHQQIAYTQSSGSAYGITDAFQNLIPNEKSNLGWRSLADLFLGEDEQRKAVEGSLTGKPIVELLPPDFVQCQMKALTLARAVKSQESTVEAVQTELTELLGPDFANQLTQSLTAAEATVAAPDKNLPTVLLTTFKGCKGLSAGHVFIVGVHEAGMPKNNTHIDDVEISQFVVALTRTRKQCHILSNDWVYSPKGKKGEWLAAFQPSVFMNWIPKDLIEDHGKLRAKNL